MIQTLLVALLLAWSSGPGLVGSSTEADFVCPEEFGYYAHPNDCTLYYVCVFGGSLLESCSGGLMYSNTLQTCDWPRNVDCLNGSPVWTNATAQAHSKNPAQASAHNIAQTDTRNIALTENRNIAQVEHQNVAQALDQDTVQIQRRYPAQAQAQKQPDLQPPPRQPLDLGSSAIEEYPQQRLSRSYAGAQPSFKNYEAEAVPNGRSISSKLVQVQRVTEPSEDYEDSSDYISQRYAANVSNKVEPQRQAASKDYEYYYDYEETPQVQTTTTTTTTPKPVPVIRHHVTQQPQPPPRRRPGAKPTLLPPAAQIVKGASSSVRNIFTDPPYRPDPVYATPEPNSPATKCHRSSCVIPDCNCGGKDIPGGLDVNNTPQLVLLTFDDSVNDLNKNLYKDLFEVGRKNPNGCPISATFYVSHEWTDYSQVQNLAADGHEIASHSISHSFGEQFGTSKWTKEINGQREILAAYGGVKMSSVRGMRAPFLAIGGNNMFKMLYDSNFTYDSSMPVYENNPPSWPYTLDYKIFHQCMIPPCPSKSFPGVWEVPMVMWQDLKGGRCSMGDACSNPATAQGVYEMLVKNFERHYTTNRAPFGLYYHAAWFTQAHHKEGFESFLDVLVSMEDVWLVTNWQAIQWIRNPVGINQGLLTFPPFDCRSQEYKANLPKRCTSARVCNLWHKSGVRYMKTCQNCPEAYPWTGSTGV